MDINTRNYDDFIKVISKLNNIVGKNSFRDMTIEDLEYLFMWAESIESEWKHLESDIDDWISIIENIEENKMKIEIKQEKKLTLISITEYNKSEYSILVNLLNSFNCFYPWYDIINKDVRSMSLVNLGGFVNNQRFSEKYELDLFNWEYKIEIEEK